MPIYEHEIGPIKWSEDLTFPFCEFCLNYQKCMCPAKDAEQCDFCQEGCQCGYKEAHEQGLDECTCDCDCGEDDCEICGEGACICGADEYPSYCGCDCTCTPCTCSCECEILVIEHKSFNRWVEENCYVCDPQCFSPQYLDLGKMPTILDVEHRYCLTSVGPYEFGVRVIPEIIERRKPIRTMQEMLGIPDFEALTKEREYHIFRERNIVDIIIDDRKAQIRFDGPTYLAILSKYADWQRPGYDLPTVWMSLTPNEILTQKPGLELAKGHVLIGGLGMGWLTKRVLEKPGVDFVTQVDIDADILQFFGEPLANMYSNIELVHDNFWQFISNNDLSQFDTILIDIWPRYRDARFDKQWQELRKLHPNSWAWGYRANRHLKRKKP